MAREQLPHVKRQLWWVRANIGAGIALLVVMAVFLALHILDVVAASPEGLVFPLFYACFMGITAAVGKRHTRAAIGRVFCRTQPTQQRSKMQATNSPMPR
ncbi:hypothetical protein CRI93_02390 [Longimonas halophila]|uniref:Uncharacterized protein n=2 Tax=Longimonas halophila TaxID=1469170 RepID=A0A2H3PBF8_9BACT|nr:hypothetical protein CRI93_02390 [Longimonas halophila]